MDVRVGLWRKLNAEELMLLNCGVGEDSWESWCEDLTHWKRPWCWEGLRAGGEGDDRGWDGWMASLTQWTWIWVDYGSWWLTWRPGVLQFMGSQRVGHDWATELNWTDVQITVTTVEGSRIILCAKWLISLTILTEEIWETNVHVKVLEEWLVKR